MIRLSEVNDSIDPSSYDKKYLSSSKGWKNKSLPAVGVVNSPLLTEISVYCFLIWSVVFVTSILSISGLDTGVKKLFSPISNDGFRSSKSLTNNEVFVPIPPFQNYQKAWK